MHAVSFLPEPKSSRRNVGRYTLSTERGIQIVVTEEFQFVADHDVEPPV